MKTKMTKWLWVIPALAFAFAGPLHAEEDNNDSKSNDCYECCTADYCFGNPTCGTWSFQADWLYWRPCNEGLVLGLDDQLRFKDHRVHSEDQGTEFGGKKQPDIEVFQSGKVVRPDSGGHSGFRFGIGYQGDCKTWDMMLKWTYFDPKSVASFNGKHKKGLPVATPFTGLGVTNADIFTITIVEPGADFAYLPFFGVKGSHRMILDFVDLEFGRPIDFCDCLSLRPHVALRYMTLDQHYSVKTKGLVFAREGESLNPPIGFAKTAEKFEYRFQGLGPRVGINSEWDLGCNFGLYADAAASLILGDRRAKNKAKTFSAPLTYTDGTEPAPEDWNGDVTIAKGDRKSTKTCTKPVFELGIGLTYKCSLCDGKYNTGFKIGWEHHYLGNHSISDTEAMINPLLGSGVTTRDDSDLTIQGLTISAMFQF